jgi:hypothetical protein
MGQSNAQTAIEISAGFLLDQVKFARRLFDFVDALLVLAVTQANVEGLMRDPALQRAYATYKAPPPDSLRRPISVNALAQSLRLPFETVRRRVSRLTLLGLFKSLPAGVYVPAAQLQLPGHHKVAEACFARIFALYEQLAGLDEFKDLPPPREAWCGPPPVRAAARISGEYLLRLADLLTAKLGDPTDAAIWFEILRSNTAGHSTPQASGGSERVPVRIAMVAKRLGLPTETVRRRVTQLVSAGACELTARGLIIPQATLDQPDFSEIAEKNLAYLRHMFAALGQLGVLEAWRARWVRASA